MNMRVRVYHNGDDVYLVWRPDGPIKECRGFAIERRRKGRSSELLSSWMGFEGTTWKRGERRPSNVWPIQKFTWIDYSTRSGETVQYRVIPMVGGAGNL